MPGTRFAAVRSVVAASHKRVTSAGRRSECKKAILEEIAFGITAMLAVSGSVQYVRP